MARADGWLPAYQESYKGKTWVDGSIINQERKQNIFVPGDRSGEI